MLTCSALKRKYRNILLNNDPKKSKSNRNVLFVYLHGDRDTLLERLKTRQGHFMPASLLDSQLATLEVPHDDEHSLTVDIKHNITLIVEQIIRQCLD